MSTQLYYINHADILGDEQDLLVEATSVEEALYLWMEHYDIDPDDLGKSPEEDFYPSVFAVPALTGTAHPLQWHVEVKIVN